MIRKLCLARFFTLLLAVFAGPSFATEVLTPTDAAGRIGERLTVELVVRGGGRNSEFQELYTTKNWRDDGCFILRFSPAARDAFADTNVPDLLEYYLKETIRVSGEVKQLKFGAIMKPVIYVDDVEQIELMPAGAGYLPRDKYESRLVAGFTVLINPEVLSHRPQAAQALRFIEAQLKTMNTSLPKDKVKALQQVPIWIEWGLRKDGAAEFHASEVWLRRNGRNPAKARCVEISNVQNYVKWNSEKGVSGMLHEMSHAFHNLQLGTDHPGIHAAYEQAMQRQLYDAVRNYKGVTAPAYASTNEKEYFAEITEAYFGHNDFYPFDRAHLESHDPIGYKLLQDVWLAPLPNETERARASSAKDN